MSVELQENVDALVVIVVLTCRLAEIPEACLPSITKLIASQSGGTDGAGVLNAARYVARKSGCVCMVHRVGTCGSALLPCVSSSPPLPPRLILARNTLKNAIVTVNDEGVQVIRTRRPGTSSALGKQSRLRSQVCIVEQADEPGIMVTTSPADGLVPLAPLSPCSCDDDVGADKAADATPTSGVTSISTTSGDSSNDSDVEFEVRPEDVVLDALPAVIDTSKRGAAAATAPAARQPTPFEVPSLLSSVMSFCPIKPVYECVAEDSGGVPPSATETIVVAQDDDMFDMGSSVETVTSGSPSDGGWSATVSTTTTPELPTQRQAQQQQQDTGSHKGMHSHHTAASSHGSHSSTSDRTVGAVVGAKPAMKNARVRLLAAETENLPSPKQPKSPVVFGGSGLTPTSTSQSTAGNVPPCDSPTLPSAVFSTRGGAFSRRVFRRYVVHPVHSRPPELTVHCKCIDH